MGNTDTEVVLALPWTLTVTQLQIGSGKRHVRARVDYWFCMNMTAEIKARATKFAKTTIDKDNNHDMMDENNNSSHDHGLDSCRPVKKPKAGGLSLFARIQALLWSLPVDTCTRGATWYTFLCVETH